LCSKLPQGAVGWGDHGACFGEDLLNKGHVQRYGTQGVLESGRVENGDCVCWLSS
jgi:hypothetical protein